MNSGPAMTWFNGMNVVRLVLDEQREIGLRIEAATADAAGKRTSEFVPYEPDQSRYWRDIAFILAACIRQLLRGREALVRGAANE